MKIGIRRESKNIWEGRTPLIPNHLQKIMDKHNINFVIQPSKIRAYPDQEFTDIGVKVQENISDCPIVLAVKEIPVDFFQPQKTYMFFSHTIKGQKENIPSLKRMIELKDTLIDYEKIIDNTGKRLVFFGRFAGIAGMLDTFWALGRKFSADSIPTPFEELKQALDYNSLEQAKKSFAECGNEIRKNGLPESISPLIIGVTGYGNVSKGAQEIIDLFPCETIPAQELDNFIKKGKFSNKTIYKVVFKEEDIVENIENNKFNLKEYYTTPEKYRSIFYKYIPHLTVIVNAIYWDERYPKLLTKEYLQNNYDSERDPLVVIGDITCDVNGSIECNTKSTNSGNPIYVFDPKTGHTTDGIKGNGPVVLAVDNLPCELPRESSEFFSNALRDFIPALANVNYSLNFNDVNLPIELKKATILYKGELTPNFKYLEKYL